MEFIDELFILIIVLQGVYNLYQRVTGGNAAEKAENMPPPEEDDGTWLIMLARARDRLADARRRLAGHTQRAQRVAEGMSGAAVAPLRRAIETRLLPELQAIDRALTDLSSRFSLIDLDGEDPAAGEQAARLMSDWAAQADTLRSLLGEVGRQVALLGALEGAARWRSDPRLGGILADVDAVATSMLAPLAQAAESGWMQWPAAAPLTVPEVGDPQALRRLLADHPLVFVDPDVADGQTRWPAVIEAVARAVVQTRPEILGGINRARHPGVPAWLPRQQGRRVVFDVEASAAVWFEAAAVDAVAAVMMGPVALTALVERLARPDDPFAVVRARAGVDHRTLGPEPPAHLRVLLTARVLARLGFDVEAGAIAQRWSEMHGNPRAISLPSLFGAAVGLPTERAVEALMPWLFDLVASPVAGLGDRSFAALGHFEMSPGLWSRTRQAAGLLSAGRGFRETPRIVVAAALLTAEKSGGVDVRLDRAVHRLITDPGERPAPDPHYRPRRVDLGDPLTARDLVEAITLRAALHRKHGHRARRRL